MIDRGEESRTGFWYSDSLEFLGNDAYLQDQETGLMAETFSQQIEDLVKEINLGDLSKLPDLVFAYDFLEKLLLDSDEGEDHL